MAEADHSIAADNVSPGPVVRGSHASTAVRLLAVLIAAAGALCASNNWCFVLFPAALAAVLVDYVVCAIRPWFRLRISAAAVVGIAVGILLSVGPGWAFREAFGTEPPDGVRDVRTWRHYLGGPGEHALIIEFTADADALRTLLNSHPVSSDSRKVERWRDAGGGWEPVFGIFVGPGLTSSAQSSWKRIRPLENPEVLDLGPSNNGSLVLFCEPQTGRCVVLHVRY